MHGVLVPYFGQVVNVMYGTRTGHLFSTEGQLTLILGRGSNVNQLTFSSGVEILMCSLTNVC